MYNLSILQIKNRLLITVRSTLPYSSNNSTDISKVSRSRKFKNPEEFPLLPKLHNAIGNSLANVLNALLHLYVISSALRV